ncbi:MAG: hypothetical protein KKC01_13440 [Gammaproteobacteria bacterium]|nr:hypothetical protein [Gammaproteobacteria bacterium]
MSVASASGQSTGKVLDNPVRQCTVMQTLPKQHVIQGCCLAALWLTSLSHATEAVPDPALLLFIAGFSAQGQFIDPLAMDQAMTAMDGNSTTDRPIQPAVTDAVVDSPSALDPPAGTDLDAAEHIDEEQNHEQH